MARPAQDVTEAELAVLQVLWDRGPATIRQISDLVYERGGASQYATVQKLLERLEAKDAVRRDRAGGVHRFEAAIDRDDLIGRRLQAVAETLCEGSITPLLTHLVRAERLTEHDRRALRELVDQLDRRITAGPGKGRGGKGR
jgi:predicted transcriptional regulator